MQPTPTKRKNDSANLLQSVDRALTVLETLALENDPIGLMELSRKVGLNASTTYRLLYTLQAHGLVWQDTGTRRYGLGLKVLQLAAAARDRLDIRQEARPFLERLARETGESANLVVLQGREAVYIDQVSSLQPIRAFSQIGARVPLHCTGVGKVFLAAMSPTERDSLLQKDLPGFTEHTITDPARLGEVLDQVREDGFALDLEERQQQVRCIAAPVFDDQSEVVAAISISGPAHRLPPQHMRELAPSVVQAALEVSSQLGYPGGALD